MLASEKMLNASSNSSTPLVNLIAIMKYSVGARFFTGTFEFFAFSVINGF